MNETVYASWQVTKESSLFPAVLVFGGLILLFLSSFFIIFILQKSTQILLLVIPIILFLLLLAAIPELLKSLRVVSSSYFAYITEKGIYKRSGEKNYQFIPWGQMTGFDVTYFHSNTPLGKLFPRPIRFLIKSQYSEDSFAIDAFGVEVDTVQAYLKENNVAFGFVT